MKTVKEVSEISGVSVRTLHHYDSIGLLKPTQVSEAGYRLYDDAAVARLQTVLMFRELAFPLKEIKIIMDSPDFDLHTALEQHITLLELQKNRLDGLISLANDIIYKGVNTMDFSAFDKSKIDEYADEVKSRWGNTAAYKEYEKKSAVQNGGNGKEAIDKFMSQFAVFGRITETPADGPEAQAAVAALQQYITDHFYTCTKEILAGLGEMYTADERFSQNIDAAGGPGTAKFVAKAIKVYCK